MLIDPKNFMNMNTYPPSDQLGMIWAFLRGRIGSRLAEISFKLPNDEAR